MSCSKPLPPFVCDSLYYLKRDHLDRFTIVCRPLKNFIDRYFHAKPYRVFDLLLIRGGSYALCHLSLVQWHPNRDYYSAQQFLAGQNCSFELGDDEKFYSFAEMRPYLSPTVRIKNTFIYVAIDSTYNPEHIVEMESLAYLWRDSGIMIMRDNLERFGAEDFQPILNSPTILQCRNLHITRAYFSFKDYQVLYTVNAINIFIFNGEDDINPNYLPDFLEQPGVKPVVTLDRFGHEIIVNLLDRLSKAFSSAVVPNAFKIEFVQNNEPLTEFRETNNTSGEKLELKKRLQNEDMFFHYTLERSTI